MIKSNLNVKLAENNLKISKVYNDTGISRSTLTTLRHFFKRFPMIAYAIVGAFLLGFICFIDIPRYRMISS